MAFKFSPRWYQREAIDSVFEYFKTHKGNPIIALPTGTGKSWLPAMFMHEVLTVWPAQRMMLISHVQELIEQDLEKLQLLWPLAPVGVCCAGLGRTETHAALTFGTVGSMVSRAEKFGHIDIIFIDEAHMVSPKNQTMYRKLIDKLLLANPQLKVIGLTATHYRLGSGLLVGADQLFTDICYNQCTVDAFMRFIAEGHLAPLVSRGTGFDINTEGLHTRMGDFVQSELEERVNNDTLIDAIVNDIMTKGHGRRSWLTFCTSIDHSEKVAARMCDKGVRTIAVHSKMGKKLREAALRDFKAGTVQSLTNQGVLTTGHDFPRLDLINMLRPTKSAALWVQMLGRGTRPLEGKTDCLVLDYAGNSGRLGPINDPVMPNRKGKKKGKQPAPMKVCGNEACLLYVPASARNCPECGHEFVFIDAEDKLDTEASANKVMKMPTKPIVGTFPVDSVTYHMRQKLLTKAQLEAGAEQKAPYLHVRYKCGLRFFNENIFLESSAAFARSDAYRWWELHSAGDKPVPKSVEQALELVGEGALHVVTHVKIWSNNKPHPKVLNYAHSSGKRTTDANVVAPT